MEGGALLLEVGKAGLNEGGGFGSAEGGGLAGRLACGRVADALRPGGAG
jgi:hypothetical protein